MMRHRKNIHKTVLCKMYLKKKCDYSSEDCYFTHAANTPTTPVKTVDKQSDEPQVKTQGFWDTQSNLAPPSKESATKQGPSQSEWLQMKNTLHHLNQLMAKYQ